MLASPPPPSASASESESEDLSVRAVGRPGDLGWVLLAHAERYDEEYGWRGTFEGLVARVLADFAQPRPVAAPPQAGWIAELGGRRVGCVFCVADPTDRDAAVLRLLLVDPAARGHGLGGRLVDACLDFARAAGYARIRLWTNEPLAAARRLYLARGFRLTAEHPHADFGPKLVGQTYELGFARVTPRGSVAPGSARRAG